MARYADILGSPALAYTPPPQSTGTMLVPLLLLFSILYLVVNLRPLYSNKPTPIPPSLDSNSSATPIPEDQESGSTSAVRRRRTRQESEQADGDMPFLSAPSSEARIGNLNLGRKPPRSPQAGRGRFSTTPNHTQGHLHPPQPQQPRQQSFNLSAPPFSHPRNLYRPPPRFSPSPNTTPSLSPSRSPSLPSASASASNPTSSGTAHSNLSHSAPPTVADLTSLKVEVDSLRQQLAESRAREEQTMMQVHHLQQVLSTTLSHPAAWAQQQQHQAYHHPHAAHQAWLSSPPNHSHSHSHSHSHAPSPLSQHSHQFSSPSPPGQLQQHQLVIPQPQYAQGYSPAPPPPSAHGVGHPGLPHMAHSMPPLEVGSLGPYTVPPPPPAQGSQRDGYPFPVTPGSLLSPPPPPQQQQQMHSGQGQGQGQGQVSSPPHPGQQFADALAAALSAAAARAASFGQQQSQPASAASAGAGGWFERAERPREAEGEREAVRQDLFGAILRRPGVHAGVPGMTSVNRQLGATPPPPPPVQQPQVALAGTNAHAHAGLLDEPSTAGLSGEPLGVGAENSLSLSMSLPSLERLPSPFDEPPQHATQPQAQAQQAEESGADLSVPSLTSAVSAPSILLPDLEGSTPAEVTDLLQSVDHALSSFSSSYPAQPYPHYSSGAAQAQEGEGALRLAVSMTAPLLRIQPSTPTAPNSPGDVELLGSGSSGEEGGGSDPSVYSQRSSFEFRSSASSGDLRAAAEGEQVDGVEQPVDGKGREGREGRKRWVTLHTSMPRSEGVEGYGEGQEGGEGGLGLSIGPLPGVQ